MKIPTPLPPAFVSEGMRLMSPEEKERYHRFSHIPSREMYLAARWFSRTLLGELVRRPPDTLEFIKGEGGKPYLVHDRDLFFNVSHSAGTIAFISSERGETGVDVEEARDRDCLNLARHFFSPREIKALERENSPEGVVDLFFRIWTQKEAYLKGTGKGLPGGLKHYTVPCVSGDSLLDGFFIESFDPGPGIRGAYALVSS